MWKFKSVATNQNTEVRVDGDKLLTEVVITLSKEGKEDETFTTKIESEAVLEATIKALEKRLNDRDEFQSKDFSNYVPPVPEAPKVIEPTAEEKAREMWLAQWQVYSKANTAMKALSEAGIEATEDEMTRFNALKKWVGDNRKPEYSQFM